MQSVGFRRSEVCNRQRGNIAPGVRYRTGKLCLDPVVFIALCEYFVASWWISVLRRSKQRWLFTAVASSCLVSPLDQSESRHIQDQNSFYSVYVVHFIECTATKVTIEVQITLDH